ncbi:MAG TPA: hypothetical protein PLG90_12230 [Ignavibacteria bacterium]|nr:hypothetical protein [Ignavibacteria bacterium]
MKYLIGNPDIGKTYRVEFNKESVYDAEILEHEGGCWAKVKVVKVLPSKMEKSYNTGQIFDIKLGMYDLLEI